jgi:hypothetical protein
VGCVVIYTTKRTPGALHIGRVGCWDLPRTSSSCRFNSERFAQFSWLVIEEDFHLPGLVAERALPTLFVNLGQDVGRIEPHKPRFPQAVEAALFALLTVPLEDITDSDVDWRPFRVPWVYTLTDDLFGRAPEPPDAGSLTWETELIWRSNGECNEFEVPSRLPLNEDADQKTSYLSDGTWHDLARARASLLFAATLPHFRAFASDGIDEFLAHITVVEAALGSPVDHDQKQRSKRSGSKNPGATERVAVRLGTLLNEPEAGDRYKALFAERSNFLHGREMTNIPSKFHLEARRLDV